MNFVHKKYLIGNSVEVIVLQKASERLYQKLRLLDVNELDNWVTSSLHKPSPKEIAQLVLKDLT